MLFFPRIEKVLVFSNIPPSIRRSFNLESHSQISAQFLLQDASLRPIRECSFYQLSKNFPKSCTMTPIVVAPLLQGKRC